MPVVDLATLAFEIDGGLAEQGARRVNAALDAIERKAAAALQAVARFGQGLGNVGGAGVGGALSRVEQAALRHQQRLEQIAARREAATQRHEQRLIEIEAAAAARREGRRNQELNSLQAFLRRYSSTIREAGESIQQAGFGLATLSAGVVEFGRRSVQSAIDIDRQVNVLKALTGSAEQAERRFASLVATARATPGLTTSLAASLDTQLRVAGAAERSIDRLLPVIGKLNAVSSLQDPQRFAQNLVQLITQNFEKIDLKELVGQSPLAGELIKQVFSVDSPINAEAIRQSADKLGIRTIDAFADALGKAGANNPKLAKVTESLGTQLEKLQDRVTVALRPLGLKILEILVPAIERAVPIIEKLLQKFNELPGGVQTAIFAVTGLSLALGPLAIAAGGVIQTVGAIGNLTTALVQVRAAGGIAAIFGAGGSAGIIGALTSINPLVLALTAALVVGGIAWVEYGRRADEALALASRTSREFLPGMAPPEIVGGKNGGLREAQITPIGDVGFAPPAPPTPITKKEAQSLVNKRLEQLVQDSKGNLEQAKAKLELIRKTDAKLDEALRFLDTDRQLRKSLTGGGGKSASTTILGRLTEELAEVEKQIRSLQNIAGQEFELKIKVDQARDLQQNLEKILDLRREVGLPIKEALPTTATGAEEAVRRLNALKDFQEGLEKLASNPPKLSTAVFDQIGKDVIEQLEAFDKLRDGIIAKSPEAKEATLEQQLVTGKLAEEYQKLNSSQQEYLLNLARQTDEQNAATEAMEKFKSLQEQLNGKLSRAKELNAEQTLQIQLQSEKYKDLTDEQRKQLGELARRIDTENAFQKQIEEAERATERFHDSLSDVFGRLLDGPKAFFEGLLGLLKQTLARMLGDLLASQALKILGIVPGGGQQASSGAARGGGFGGAIGSIVSAFGGGLGANVFTTPPIAGGSIPSIGGGTFPGLGGGGVPGLGGGFNLGGLLGRIPGIGGIFGGGSAGAAARLANLPLLPGGGDTGAGVSFGAAATSPGLAASLGGFGLLAGGGFLGSLVGGSSPTRRLIGSIGGSLGLAGLGGLGLFGGGIQAALPALFSNPITAIIGGAIIGGLALSRLFGGGTFKKFQDVVESTYQVKVKGDQPGKQLFQQVESLGKSAFGSFSKNIQRTVQLDEARDLIGQYAEATNQEGSALAKRMRQIREIGELGNPLNQFVRREFGGAFFAGQSVIAGERRAEVIQAGSSGYVFPSVIDYLGKAFAQLERKVAATPRGGNQQMAALMGALVEILDRMLAVPEGHVFVKGAEQARNQIGRIVREGFAANTGEQGEFAKQLGL